jgi:hypothetical protein
MEMLKLKSQLSFTFKDRHLRNRLGVGVTSLILYS